MSKNNVQMLRNQVLQKRSCFGLRKLNIGVASVLLGTVFFVGHVSADSNNAGDNTVVPPAPVSINDIGTQGAYTSSENTEKEITENNNVEASQQQNNDSTKQSISLPSSESNTSVLNVEKSTPGGTPINTANVLSQQLNNVSSADLSKNGGYDPVKWGTMDVNAWDLGTYAITDATKGSPAQYELTLTGYHGDKDHIIVPSLKDFADAGKIPSLDSGSFKFDDKELLTNDLVITPEFMRNLMKNNNPISLAFSSNGGHSSIAADGDWSWTFSRTNDGINPMSDNRLTDVSFVNSANGNTTGFGFSTMSGMEESSKFGHVTSINHMFDGDHLSDLKFLSAVLPPQPFSSTNSYGFTPITMVAAFRGNSLTNLDGFERNWVHSTIYSSDTSEMFAHNQLTNIFTDSAREFSRLGINGVKVNEMFAYNNLTNIDSLTDALRMSTFSSASGMFRNNSISSLWSLSSIPDTFDFKSIDLSYMFANNKLTELPGIFFLSSQESINGDNLLASGVSLLDSEGVTVNAKGLFMNNQLSDISYAANWDTKNVSDLSAIFQGNQISDVSALNEWKTDNAIDMSYALASNKIGDVSSLSSWNTSNALNMQGLFYDNRLKSLKGLEKWNISKVTDLSHAFQSNQLTDAFAISNWDTSKVTDMNYLMAINQLTNLDAFSKWQTSNVTNFQNAFYNNKLLTVDGVKNFDTSKAISFAEMFKSNQLGDKVDLSKWNTGNVTDISGMFYNNPINNYLILNNWKLDRLTKADNFTISGPGVISMVNVSVPSNFDWKKVFDNHQVLATNNSTLLNSKEMPIDQYVTDFSLDGSDSNTVRRYFNNSIAISSDGTAIEKDVANRLQSTVNLLNSDGIWNFVVNSSTPINSLKAEDIITTANAYLLAKVSDKQVYCLPSQVVHYQDRGKKIADDTIYKLSFSRTYTVDTSSLNVTFGQWKNDHVTQTGTHVEGASLTFSGVDTKQDVDSFKFVIKDLPIVGYHRVKYASLTTSIGLGTGQVDDSDLVLSDFTFEYHPDNVLTVKYVDDSNGITFLTHTYDNLDVHNYSGSIGAPAGFAGGDVGAYYSFSSLDKVDGILFNHGDKDMTAFNISPSDSNAVESWNNKVLTVHVIPKAAKATLIANDNTTLKFASNNDPKPNDKAFIVDTKNAGKQYLTRTTTCTLTLDEYYDSKLNAVRLTNFMASDQNGRKVDVLLTDKGISCGDSISFNEITPQAYSVSVAEDKANDFSSLSMNEYGGFYFITSLSPLGEKSVYSLDEKGNRIYDQSDITSSSVLYATSFIGNSLTFNWNLIGYLYLRPYYLTLQGVDSQSGDVVNTISLNDPLYYGGDKDGSISFDLSTVVPDKYKLRDVLDSQMKVTLNKLGQSSLLNPRNKNFAGWNGGYWDAGKRHSFLKINLDHQTKALSDSKTINEKIDYQYKDGKVAAPEYLSSIVFSRSGSRDLVTNAITWNDWVSDKPAFDTVTSPVIAGYTPDKIVVNERKVDASSTDINHVVTYSPNVQVLSLRYIDAFGKQVGQDQIFNGVTDQTVDVKYQLPVNYVLNSLIPTSYKLSYQDNVLYAIVSPKVTLTKDSKTITRTILITMPTNKVQTVLQSVVFTRNCYRNDVTDEITYGAWRGDGIFAAYIPETVSGYIAPVINSQKVTVNSDNLTVSSSYQKMSQVTHPLYIDVNGKGYDHVPAGYKIVTGQNVKDGSLLIIKEVMPQVSVPEYVTRTVKIMMPNGKVRTITQRVKKGSSFSAIHLPKLRGYQVKTTGDIGKVSANENVNVTVNFVK